MRQLYWIQRTEQSGWEVAELVSQGDMFAIGTVKPFHVSTISFLGPRLHEPVWLEPKKKRAPATPAVPSELDVVIAIDDTTSTEPAPSRDPWVIDNFVEVHSKRDKDCGVVALANIMQVPYKEARVIAFHHGWSSTSGMQVGFLEAILADKYECVERAELCGGYVRDYARPGVFLVYCHKHVIASVNGRLYNVQGMQGHAVTDVQEIFPQ